MCIFSEAEWRATSGTLLKLAAVKKPFAIYRCISMNSNVMKKFIFSCKLFQKVKLSYILDSLHVK